MNYDEMMAQGSDYGCKYCPIHQVEYSGRVCPQCDEPENTNEDR
jgi:hypothetical protein